ncbi:hypothetical protein [Halomonas denitrificans]|uniref:hypothetical protein n=1 Tax=Halomonas denitrificans TaxID=370769 RepID=UPI0013008ECB|nr:hypothetical protein [Halomonas denitrificans]
MAVIMELVRDIIKNPIGHLIAALCLSLGILIALDANLAGLFLELWGVLITLSSIHQTRKYFGAEGLDAAMGNRLKELKALLPLKEEKKRASVDVMESVLVEGGTIAQLRQTVVHNVDEPSLLTLKEDIKKLSENQEVIMGMVKEDHEKFESAIKNFTDAAEKASDEVKQTFSDIHVNGTELATVGVVLIFIGAVLSATQ